MRYHIRYGKSRERSYEEFRNPKVKKNLLVQTHFERLPDQRVSHIRQ